MASESEPWRMPGVPEGALHSEREREIARRVSETLRDWIDRSLEQLQSKQRAELEDRLRDIEREIELAVREERSWESELETRLRALQSFELEFGSTRTGEESRTLFREVRDHLATREDRWQQILTQLDRLRDRS